MAYTNIDDPSAHFQVKLWTGTGAAGNTITLDGNSDMQPDWMWHKEPTDANGWHQIDSSRGTTYVLASQNTGAEYDVLNTYISSFNSNGFTAGYGDSSINSNGVSQCSWMWHCNGGTTSSNTDGSITSTVQANQDAGFSIVTYTGNGSASTIGHGLGVVPAMIIVKCRNAGSTNWTVYHKNSNATPQNYILELNNANAAADNDRFNDTAPTSSVFSVNAGSSTVNQNTNTYVAYCFAEKQGYSKFGKYVGNGSADGAFVYTGFKPAFVLVKNASATESWVVYDTARNTFNLTNLKLSPDTADSENNNSAIGGAAYNNIDILSNGFKCRSNNAATNGSGNTIIYMAFAEHPFTTSTGIPTTAR